MIEIDLWYYWIWQHAETTSYSYTYAMYIFKKRRRCSSLCSFTHLLIFACTTKLLNPGSCAPKLGTVMLSIRNTKGFFEIPIRSSGYFHYREGGGSTEVLPLHMYYVIILPWFIRVADSSWAMAQSTIIVLLGAEKPCLPRHQEDKKKRYDMSGETQDGRYFRST